MMLARRRPGPLPLAVTSVTSHQRARQRAQSGTDGRALRSTDHRPLSASLAQRGHTQSVIPLTISDPNSNVLNERTRTAIVVCVCVCVRCLFINVNGIHMKDG